MGARLCGTHAPEAGSAGLDALGVRRRAATRTTRRWAEQGDLWDVAATARPDAEPVADRFDFSSSEIHRSSDRTPTGAMRSYAQRQRSVQTEDIARFLEVNGAVQRGRGTDYRLSISPRPSAAYDLWRGPNGSVTFLMGT